MKKITVSSSLQDFVQDVFINYYGSLMPQDRKRQDLVQGMLNDIQMHYGSLDPQTLEAWEMVLGFVFGRNASDQISSRLLPRDGFSGKKNGSWITDRLTFLMNEPNIDIRLHDGLVKINQSQDDDQLFCAKMTQAIDIVEYSHKALFIRHTRAYLLHTASHKTRSVCIIGLVLGFILSIDWALGLCFALGLWVYGFMSKRYRQVLEQQCMIFEMHGYQRFSNIIRLHLKHAHSKLAQSA